jgi:long-subunit fatty acid transport protein
VRLGRGRGERHGRVHLEEALAFEPGAQGADHGGPAGEQLDVETHGAPGYRRSARLSQWAALLAALLGVAGEARAGGWWTLDRGPSNLGRGGANIAAPDDPIALYTNPSALAHLEGLQLNLDANMVFDDRVFTRAPDSPNGPLRTYKPVTNEQPTWPPSPGIFVSYNLGTVGIEELTVGLGVYGPPRSDRTWPSTVGNENGLYTASQRYSELESHNLQIHYALGVGYQLPWYGLRVGITGMLIDQIIDSRLVLNAPCPQVCDPSGENEDYDVDVQVDAKDSFIPGATIGLSAAPVEWLTIALAYQLPYDVDAEGNVSVKLSEFYTDAGAELQGDRIRVKLKMPQIFRAAVRYDAPERFFDAELAFVWEGWGRNEEILFQPQGVQFAINGNTIPLNDVVLPSGLRDTWSVRLGGSVNAVPELLRVRLGGFYERAALAETRLSPSAFDLDKVGGSLGARVDLPYGAWLDLTGAYVQWLTAEVTNSEVKLQNALTGEAKHPIANGTYENTQIWLMAGLGVRLDI